jgi:uncharacterized protein (TIGR02145 family)
MKRINIAIILIMMSCLYSYSQTVPVIKIGNQIWMTTNLNVSKFSNGDPIPQAITNKDWVEACEKKKPVWCYYNNNAANSNKLGKLYNFYAINDGRGLAPKGWHIPTQNEWQNLLDTLLQIHNNDDDLVSKSMKTNIGWKNYVGKIIAYRSCSQCNGNGKRFSGSRYVTCGWCVGSTVEQYLADKTFVGNGTNKSGFTGLPVGIRDSDGKFRHSGEYAIWWSSTDFWSSTELELSEAFNYLISNQNGVNSKHKLSICSGLSVRCVKD